MPNLQCVQESQSAQARAAAYCLIAHGFQYPDRDTLTALADPTRWEQWPDVLHEGDGQVRTSLQSVRDAVMAMVDRSCPEPLELQHRYDELFGHAVQGACPAYEMEYGRNEIMRQASDLADLAGFYRAFGLEIANGADGRPDHIAAECDFMSALCSKEAHAYTQDDQTNVDICLDAERSFLRDHLARWLPSLTHRIKEADGEGFFNAMARFADAFVNAECSFFDIHAGPATLELKPPDPVLDTQISCGSTGCGEGGTNDQFIPLGTDLANSEDR